MFIWHYAVNAPFADDWSRMPLVSDALHHQLRLPDLWEQYSEARLVVSNVFVIGFGFVNRLNLRIGRAVRRGGVRRDVLPAAPGRPLVSRAPARRSSPSSHSASCGSASSGVSNALWAFQLAWYLVLLFLFAAIYFLCVRPRYRPLALTLAIIAAIGGSLSMVQGFLIWPVGLVALLWVWTAERKRWAEVGIWLGAGAVTTLVYIWGYTWNAGCIGPARNCSMTTNASHPGRFGSYFFTLAGNVLGVAVRWHSKWEQLIGVVIVAAAVFVIVYEIRHRKPERISLPLLMIVYALLFDLTLALGRSGQRSVAGQQGRYTMPNLILLVALLVFACAHPPRLPRGARG